MVLYRIFALIYAAGALLFYKQCSESAPYQAPLSVDSMVSMQRGIPSMVLQPAILISDSLPFEYSPK